jgi:hypothetical protein
MNRWRTRNSTARLTRTLARLSLFGRYADSALTGYPALLEVVIVDVVQPDGERAIQQPVCPLVLALFGLCSACDLTMPRYTLTCPYSPLPRDPRSHRADLVFPGLIFPTVTVLSTSRIVPFLWDKSLASAIQDHCFPGSGGGLSPTYTGLTSLDCGICALVHYFSLALAAPGGRTYLPLLIANFAPIAALPFLEARRPGRAHALRLRVVSAVALAAVAFTGGLVMPPFWLVLIAVGTPRLRAPLAADAARRTALGALALYALPAAFIVRAIAPESATLSMLYPALAGLTLPVLWLAAPWARGSGRATGGTRTARALYVALGLGAAVAHTSTSAPLLARGGLGALSQVLLPQAAPGAGAPADVAALASLQWDGVFTFASSALASLWFARDGRELAAIATWDVVAGALFGPGAALAAVFCWREGYMNAQ